MRVDGSGPNVRQDGKALPEPAWQARLARSRRQIRHIETFGSLNPKIK
jgi:hypothetical protein